LRPIGALRKTSAEFAFDGISNEYRAPDLDGDGVDEWVQADFAEPARSST
jgi:hypothetical protein